MILRKRQVHVDHPLPFQTHQAHIIISHHQLTTPHHHTVTHQLGHHTTALPLDHPMRRQIPQCHPTMHQRHHIRNNHLPHHTTTTLTPQTKHKNGLCKINNLATTG